MANVAFRTQHSDIWWVFLLQGLALIVLGIMLLTEPAATLVALTTFLGFYWFDRTHDQSHGEEVAGV